MIGIRRNVVLLLASVCLFGCLAVAVPADVSATTGPIQSFPPPRYTIAAQVEHLYTGQYAMKSAAPASRLRDGAMGIAINSDDGALYGMVQFFAYDAAGKAYMWVGTLYNFRQTGKNAVSVQIVGAAGKPVLGAMSVQRAASGDLSGTIQFGGHAMLLAGTNCPDEASRHWSRAYDTPGMREPARPSAARTGSPRHARFE